MVKLDFVEQDMTILVKIISAVLFLAVIAGTGYHYTDKALQQQSIAAAIAELEAYQPILQEYYKNSQQLPAVGVVFSHASNPQSRYGCDIDGNCPTSYERLLNDPKRAFMSKVIADLDEPNRIFMAFMERDGKIVTYCGPWTVQSEASMAMALLPKTCNTEIKKILGL